MLRSALRQVTNLFVGALSDGFIEGIKEEEEAAKAEEMARRTAYAAAKDAGADETTLSKLELSSVRRFRRLRMLCGRLGLSRIAEIKDKIVRQTTESSVRLRKRLLALVADTKPYKAYRYLSCVAKTIVSNEWFQHVRCRIEPLCKCTAVSTLLHIFARQGKAYAHSTVVCAGGPNCGPSDPVDSVKL
jgi:hypothetical protein